MADLIDFNHLIEVGPDGTHPEATPERLKDFHCDLGDSSQGPIGYCARILAYSAEQALEILKDVITEDLGGGSFAAPEIDITNALRGTQHDAAVQYVAVYFNPDALNIQDINEWDYD